MSGVLLGLHDRLQRDRISEYLPTMSYDQERRLYHNERDGTVGFVCEITPITFMGEQLLSSLNAFLTAKWPDKTIAQFILYSDPNLDFVLTPYRRLRGDETDFEIAASPSRQFLRKWSLSYADYLESIRYQGIDRNEVPVPFRNFRAFAAVKIPCSIKEFETRSQDIQLLLENRETLIGAFKTCTIGIQHLSPGAYIRLMYQIWNPNHPMPIRLGPNEKLSDKPYSDRPYIGWDTTQPIYDQIIAKDTTITTGIKRLRVDGWHVLTKTPAIFPSNISPLDINLLIGDLHRANRKQITTPFLLSLILDLDSQESSITRKGNLVLGQSNALPTLGPGMKKRHDEFLKAQGVMESGTRIIQGMVALTLMARTSQELASTSASVDALWQQQGYRLQNEAGLNLPLFMACQPMGASWDLVFKLKRTRPAPTDTWARLIPIQGDDRTYSKPVFLFLTRRGQLIGHDLRDSPRDNNAVLFASTGSGKSFLMNYLTTSTLSVGGRAIIIDIGRSYEKLCSALDGQYIEFTSSSNICLNVFSMITPELWYSKKDEDREQLAIHRTTCISILAQMANPGSLISDTEKSILSNCLDECYEDAFKDGQEFNIDMVINKLNEIQSVFDQTNRPDVFPSHLAVRLTAFSSKGRHGQWFQGKFNVEFDKSLVVLELEELAKNEDLRQVALMLIMSVIEYKVYINPDRTRPTMIGMDEAWDLLSGANTATFLEHGFRRARKYGAGFVVITQSIFDMIDKNPQAGQAILNNCSWRIFLAPKKEEIERARDEGLISLSDIEMNLMVSAHMAPGLYSEICYFDPHNAFRLSRLHVDKKTMLLFTTHPLERELLDTLRKLGFSTWDAITEAEPYLEHLHGGVSISVIISKIMAPHNLQIINTPSPATNSSPGF